MESFPKFPINNVIFESHHFFVVEDGYPVSPGHCLIITKDSAKKDFFALTIDERNDLMNVIDITRFKIEKRQNPKPDGYNIGMNCGEAAGQSVMQFHCHVIPRYTGDMENPKGGVRYCIPEKGLY